MPCSHPAFTRKAVLRMRDGSLKKCKIFSHLSAAYRKVKVLTPEGAVEDVDRNALKAVFFVKSFAGSSTHHGSKSFKQTSPKAGQAVTVRFADGETIKGRVLNLAEGRPGFFLYPADPEDNNDLVFVLRAPDVAVEVDA
jgi:hypothetical protein